MTTHTEKTAGLIGLGVMGSAMSKNLLEAGFAVIGHDVSEAAMKAFAQIGGNPADSAARVAAGAEVLITCLPSAEALHAIVAELAASPGAARILAETSTLSLDHKLAAQKSLAGAGIVMLDCPLSGSGSQALARDVLVYASGPRDAYDRCLPVFRGFSRAPHYLGPFGNGSKMKYVANLLVAIHTVAAGEAFALARKAGLDPAQMFEVVSDGAGGSSSLKTRGPMLIADEYLPIRTMPLNLWRKDVKIISDYANALSCPTPMFSAAMPIFNAAIAEGYGEQDTAAVCRVIENMAGLPHK